MASIGQFAQAGLAGLDLFLGYQALRGQQGVARAQRSFLNQQLSFQRYRAGIDFSNQFRQAAGAQQAALGAGGIAGGQTARLFDLDTQLQLQSARGDLSRQQLEARTQANVNVAAAGDAKVLGLAQGLIDFGGSMFSIFGAP